MESGPGWHSSGAYLLRTPWNALISGLAAYAIGYGSSFFLYIVVVVNAPFFQVEKRVH